MSTSDGSVCLLQPLGLLSIRGPDSRRFLQGQLSNDVSELDATAPHPGARLLRAGLHNPQGRTLALLGLLAQDADTVLAILPRELLSATLATLRRYVLRSKVVLADESDAYRLQGLSSDAPAPAAGLCVGYGAERRLLIARASEPPMVRAADTLSYASWHALDIAAGLPQVYASTSGQFIAQMLNLDCIGAVSFTKGCYTGQEVIARAHYRGRVKRRLQRFLSREPLQLHPGDSGELSEAGSVRVVDSVQHSDGRCEFLAVAALPGQAGGSSDPEARPTAAARIEAMRLPLPYELPQ
jgi:hypothetical protein